VDAKPRYYTVKRTPGSVVHLALVARPEASSTRSGTDPEKWQLTLATPDGQECDSDVAADIEFFRSGSSQTVAVSANNTNAGTLDSTPGDRDKACADSPTLVAAVLHDKGAGSNRVQLVYLEEPPVTNLDSLPDGVEPDQVKPLVAKASSSPTPVAGGGGFGDAPTLEPGSYTETVVPGEQLYYKVRLDFGQRAAFTTDVNYDGAGPRFDSVQGLLFTVDAWTPALYRLTRAGGTPDNRENINSTAPKVSLTEYTPEVRYRNKAAFGNGYHYPALRQVSIPGYYYFAIGSERDDDPNLQTPVNVRINVAVEGQPTGEPEYAAGAPAVVTGTSSPSETATASATSSPSTGTDATAAAQETGSEAGVPVWVWIVGGLVVLAAAAGVTLGAMRRGSNAGSHQ
jgi:Ca-activated chloride channel family protein